MNPCYCGSGQSYASCCQPFHSNQRQPASCEQLMRSRYSAFCLPALDYLHQSCTARLKDEQHPEQLRDYVAQTHFIRLQVLPLAEQPVTTDEGYVHFQVWYLVDHQLCSFREVSHFLRQDGRWLYHSGRLTELPTTKIGRNDPCPCGSGRKFKSCRPHRPSGQAAA